MIGYMHPTKRGPVVISPIDDRWCIVYRNENLAFYYTPSAHLDRLALGDAERTPLARWDLVEVSEFRRDVRRNR